MENVHGLSGSTHTPQGNSPNNDPIEGISSVDPKARNTPMIKTQDHTLVQPANGENINFNIHSFGNSPQQRVNLLLDAQASNFKNVDLPGTGQAIQSGGGTIVGINGVGFSSKSLISNSFGPCTPIVAFYRNGEMGLFHAATAIPTDSRRKDLLDSNRRPTDIFVITRTGEGNYRGRQSAHVIDITNTPPAYCNVHVVEIPPGNLAVEVSPNNINISYMR